MLTSYRVSDINDREKKKFIHIKHECRIQSLAIRRVDKRKNDLNVNQKNSALNARFF
jgi:hypothetical protein